MQGFTSPFVKSRRAESQALETKRRELHNLEVRVRQISPAALAHVQGWARRAHEAGGSGGGGGGGGGGGAPPGLRKGESVQAVATNERATIVARSARDSFSNNESSRNSEMGAQVSYRSERSEIPQAITPRVFGVQARPVVVSEPVPVSVAWTGADACDADAC